MGGTDNAYIPLYRLAFMSVFNKMDQYQKGVADFVLGNLAGYIRGEQSKGLYQEVQSVRRTDASLVEQISDITKLEPDVYKLVLQRLSTLDKLGTHFVDK